MLARWGRGEPLMTDDLGFNIFRHRQGDRVIVVPEGEIDVASADRVRQETRAAQDESSVVVLDLRAVTFIDSSGMGALVELQREADANDISLALVRGPAEVQRVIDLTGLGERLTLLDDPDQAGGEFGGDDG